ncbi:hypothetical protein [Actinomycetospora soli]|uniref:hypothetical protein n=1 Tax=Actinomycetospora soli TaxID=2893887 RepID=UPI001E33F86A|nr:hypothetical protein [Actinomycetospora soli]MCD2190963.1 hypothetical protein [Actinomycetospora soli]
MLGATWALRIGDGGFFTGFGYAGLAVILLGIRGLGWSGIVQARLDRLEDSGESSDSAADEYRTG